MAGFLIKTTFYGSLGFVAFRVIARPIVRKFTGWEDTDSHAWNDA